MKRKIEISPRMFYLLLLLPFITILLVRAENVMLEKELKSFKSNYCPTCGHYRNQEAGRFELAEEGEEQ